MSIGQAMQQIRKAAAAALLGAAMAAAGCGGGGGGQATVPEPPAPDTQGPSVAGLSVAPADLRFTGGQVTIAANVTDTSGVSRVWAVVTRPDSGTDTVDLSRTAGDAYSATWGVPGNPEVGGATLTYTFTLHAQDAGGYATSVGPTVVRVQSVEAPPPMPTP